MRLITNENPHKIVAQEGKKIRDINDEYKEAYTDEEGNLVPEHFPYYTDVIYVPDSITEEIMNELYIEEDI